MSAMSEPTIAMSAGRRTMITVCVMIATLMQALDTTNATMALPYMRSSLSAGPDQITWVLSSYVVMAAIMTAPVGWLARRFGRRNLFLITMAGFTVSSMLSGMATSLTQIVIFRLMQGAFGAALIPLSQSTLLDIYPIEQRGSALSLWGVGVMVGPVVGPTIGGYITEAYHWRYIFYLNVPVGLLAMTSLWLLLDDDRNREAPPFDWIGFATIGVAIGAIQLMLDRGNQQDWFNSTEIIAALVIGCLGLYLFVVHLMTARRPLVSPRIFVDRNYVASFVMLFMVGVVL
ncbi:MAG: DHA2 family efflux MFS transporter permease subunit, partial [Hyphomicrobiaceae bacterium]